MRNEEEREMMLSRGSYYRWVLAQVFCVCSAFCSVSDNKAEITLASNY